MAKFCGKCGSPLDPSTGLCPKCDMDKAPKKPGNTTAGGHKKRFVKVLLVMIAAAIVILTAATVLSQFGVIRLPDAFCFHKWQDATCTSPKTCALCGKTSGEPLGHDWEPATCTTMQACRVCGATKGVPLGHTIETEEENDILRAQRHVKETCSVCGAVLKDTEQPMDSFVENGHFIFTPQELIDRFESFAKQFYPDFSYSFDPGDTEADDDTLCIYFHLDESSYYTYGLAFLDADDHFLTPEDLDTANIFGISLERMCELDVEAGGIPYPIDGEVSKLFYLVCDPLVSEDDMISQQAALLCAYANWMENSEPIGYSSPNNVTYAFPFVLQKVGERIIDIQAIQAFAST